MHNHNNMKPLMEGWRHYLAESSDHLLTEAEQRQAKDFVNAIKRGLALLAAKAAGEEFFKQAVQEIGPEIAGATLEWAKTIPVMGNMLSGISAFWKTGKATVKTVIAAKEVGQAAFDVLKVAADDFVGMDDSKVGNNPIAKLLNIDDRMELPIKDKFLHNFAGEMLKWLRENPDMHIPDTDKFAETVLSNFMKNKEYVSDIAPPPDPN